MKNLAKKVFTLNMIIIFSAGTAVFSQALTVSGKLFNQEGGEIISNGSIFLYPGNISTTTNLKSEYSSFCPASI